MYLFYENLHIILIVSHTCARVHTHTHMILFIIYYYFFYYPFFVFLYFIYYFLFHFSTVERFNEIFLMVFKWSIEIKANVCT
jgi:hypothetical protein